MGTPQFPSPPPKGRTEAARAPLFPSPAGLLALLFGGDTSTARRRRSLRYADRLLLSLGVSSRLQLASCGGGGFGFLQRAFLPRARRHGLSAADEERITTSNAAAILCYWTPPPPPERTVRHWSCDACHRGYVEAVNEAEALPEDRVYFEKFSYRYCSTACLGAHRRAEFVQPFSAPPPPE